MIRACDVRYCTGIRTGKARDGKGVCSIFLRVDRSINIQAKGPFLNRSLLQKVCNYLLMIFFMFTVFI
jgi:hypothetical protein